MNPSVSRAQRIALALFVVAFVVVVAGYQTGKQLVQRDNARDAQPTH